MEIVTGIIRQIIGVTSLNQKLDLRIFQLSHLKEEKGCELQMHFICLLREILSIRPQSPYSAEDCGE